MAFAASISTADPRAQSIGPRKMQIMTWTAGNGDTSGTATFTNLTSLEHVIIDGAKLTALPTFSGNVATFAFVDPTATVYGTLIGFGK